MKRFSVIFILLIISISTFAQTSERITDFREIYWGTPLDSTYRSGYQVNFELDKTSPEKRAYKIPGDDMEIGSVDLNRINYIFNDDNRMHKVLLEGPNDQINYMSFIIEHKFGPYEEDQINGTDVRIWTVKDVTITMYLHEYRDFQVFFESDWEVAKAYEENTNVDDF